MASRKGTPAKPSGIKPPSIISAAVKAQPTILVNGAAPPPQTEESRSRSRSSTRASPAERPRSITRPTTQTSVSSRPSGTSVGSTSKPPSIPSAGVSGKTVSSINKERDAIRMREKIRAEKEASARRKLEIQQEKQQQLQGARARGSSRGRTGPTSTPGSTPQRTTRSIANPSPSVAPRSISTARKPSVGQTMIKSTLHGKKPSANPGLTSPKAGSGPPEQYKLLHSVKLGADVRCLCTTGLAMWEGSRDGAIHIRDLRDASDVKPPLKSVNKDVRSEGERFFVNVIRRQGNKVWVGDSYGHLRAYSPDGSTILHYTGKGSQAGTKDMLASEDSDQHLVFAGGEDWSVLMYSSQDGAMLKNLVGHKGWIHALAMDRYHLRLWSAGADGLRIWSRDALTAAKSGKKSPDPASPNVNGEGEEESEEDHKKYCLKTIEEHAGGVTAIAAVGATIWTGGKDAKICVWRASDLFLLGKFQAHEKSVDCIKQIGQEVLTGSQLSNKVKVWNAATRELIRTIELPYNSKMVDMIHQDNYIWIGGRSPGCLAKYSVSPTAQSSTRPDGVASDQRSVDERSFRRWVNYTMSQSADPAHRQMEIPDGVSFSDALKDGVLLCALVDELDQCSANKNYSPLEVPFKVPSSQPDRLGNIQAAFSKMQELRVDPRVSAEDIEKGRLAPALDLVWELIRKYHIRLGYADNRTPQELLKWVNGKIRPYVGEEEGVVPVLNWDWCWHDGYALSALADHLGPGSIAFGKLDHSDPEWNVNTAMATAEEKHAVPRLCDVYDVVYCPFPRALMTYVACFRPKKSGKVDPDSSYIRGPGVVEDEISGEVGDLSTADWVGRSTRQLGVEDQDPVGFTVFAKDADGAPVSDCVCECTLTGPNGSIPVNAEEVADGLFACQYAAPLAPGDYTLVCKLDGMEVSNSPIHFTITSPLDGSKSYCEGPGLSGDDDAPGEFTVYAIDDQGHPSLGTECKVQMTGPVGPVYVEVQDRGDGTFFAHYQRPLSAGAHHIEVLLNDQPVRNSPVTFSVKKFADPSLCYAEGPGLSAPVDPNEAKRLAESNQDKPSMGPGEFLVTAVDREGNLVPDADCTAVLNGPHGNIPVSVHNNGDGTFSARYDTPLSPGDYELNVLIDGHPIQNFPTTFHVSRAEVDPSKSYAEGGGLMSAKEVAESHDPKLVPGEINVFALNGKGNPVLDSKCAVIITGPRGTTVPVSVERVGDGVFRANYDANSLPPGEYNVSVKLDGAEVGPFAVHVKNMASPALSYIEGPGLTSEGNEKGQGHFNVHCIAADRSPTSESEVHVTITGPNDRVVPVRVTTDRDDGTYPVQYDAPLPPGTYTVTAYVDGVPVRDCPLQLEVKKDATAADCYAKGPGLEGPLAHAELEDPTAFTVHSCDEDGNHVPGTTCEVKLIGPSGDLLGVVTNDNKDGTFSVSYLPALYRGKTKSKGAPLPAPLPPGEYMLKIGVNGKPVSNSPARFRIPEWADPNLSSASGPGLAPHKMGAGKSHFNILARDSDGKPVQLDLDQVQVLVHGPEGDVEVEVHEAKPDEKKQGITHVVQYHPTQAGDHTVEVRLNGQTIKGMPIHLAIKKGASGAMTSGIKFSCTVLARDERGDAKKEGGDRFEATCTYGDGEQLPVRVNDNKDGTYEAAYSLQGGHEYRVDVTINGHPLALSPMFHDFRGEAHQESSFY